LDVNHATGSNHELMEWEVDREKQAEAGGT
jgi:hypothetical protein